MTVSHAHVMAGILVSMTILPTVATGQDQQIGVPVEYSFRVDGELSKSIAAVEGGKQGRSQRLEKALNAILAQICRSSDPSRAVPNAQPPSDDVPGKCKASIEDFKAAYGEDVSFVFHQATLGKDFTSTARQTWYMWSPRDHGDEQVGGRRLYGARTVVFVYVHTIPAADETALRGVTRQLPTGVDSIGRDFIQGKADAVRDLLGSQDQTLALRRIANAPYAIDARAAELRYRVDVTKKTPAPIQNLREAIGILQGGAVGPAKVALTPMTFVGIQTMAIEVLPADVLWVLINNLDAKEVELSKEPFVNEGRYSWDISIAVPITKVEELDFNAEDGTVSAKKVDKAQILALLNLYPVPVDVQGTHIDVPHAVLGLGLSDRPWERLFVGVAAGVNNAQVFAGHQWTKVEKPSSLEEGDPATPSSLAADLGTQYEGTWVVGLNVPVRQVVKLLGVGK